MKKVIICEKPDLAKMVRKALNFERFESKDGYSEGDGYIVTYTFGNLFELFEIADYTGSEDKTWKLNELPYVPEKFRYKLKDDTGVRKQFKILRELMNRNDVDEIINCGDADREGELLIRLIIQHGLKGQKKISRLWLVEQTEENIRKELTRRRLDSEYDNLANEGLARTYMDWLLGINLTRYLTLKANGLLNVGRVIVPIVKIIYDRDMEIKNFVSKPYYAVEGEYSAEGINFKLTYKQKEEEDTVLTEAEAQQICNEMNDNQTIVSNIQSKAVTLQAPKLFSLDKLQSYLGKKYKMSLTESMPIIQKLYESGYITYPRTNTEYLAEGEKDKFSSLISFFAEKGERVIFKDKKSIFNNEFVESHSALTPTNKVPVLSELTEKEVIVYTAIYNRFMAVFCSDDCIVNRTIITIQNGLIEFKLQGDVLQEEGYLKYENNRSKDGILPRLKEGEVLDIQYTAVKKMTTPPKHYTIESLTNYLLNPFRKECESDDINYKDFFEGVQIGAPSTRTIIIGNAIKSGYIDLKGDSYYIQEKGVYLVNLLDDLKINLYKDKTVQFNKYLIDVNKKKMSIEQCIDSIQEELKQIINSTSHVSIKQLEGVKTERETIGECPFCKAPVHESTKVFYCSNWKEKECKFRLLKEDKYFMALNKKVTKSIAKGLLKKNKVLVKDLVSKKGAKYDAYICVEFKQPFHQYRMEFPKK